MLKAVFGGTFDPPHNAHIMIASAVTEMKLADKRAIMESIGCPAGAVPLVGNGLPCIFDERLLIYDYIYGGTGNACRTLKIRPADALRLNQVLWFIE